MSADPAAKRPRTFQCVDPLWAEYQYLSHDLECSVDYLINEAMKYFMRVRALAEQAGPGAAAGARPARAAAPAAPGAYAPPAPEAYPPAPPAGRPSPPGPSPAAVAPGYGAAPYQPPPPPRGVAAGYAAAPVGPGAAAPAASPPPPARPPGPPGRAPTLLGAGPAAGAVQARVTVPRGLQRPPPPPRRQSAPPPPYGGGMAGAGPAVRPPPAPPVPAYPPAAGGGAVPAGARPAGRLVLYYQGQRYEVSKDRFIIGRATRTNDLTIKDPNVSRQHAMVEVVGGQAYMVDMGSTNGVEYMGQRVQRKPIAPGDAFTICDHELRFAYE
ncbi:MAG: FHA domain-containing protein [Deltaproteobacteria bacterium]|nr:FHA domain-containing protein [Deltaproteobacteria bacterium]